MLSLRSSLCSYSPCLKVVLELREVEVGGGSLLDEVVHVVIKVHAEIKEGTGGYLVVDDNVGLVEVPAARADEEGGEPPISAGHVNLAVSRVGEANGAEDGVAKVALERGGEGG